MKNETVSIIVPMYNAEKQLDRCISSLLRQKYQNIEILLINDGSLDRTLEIARSWAEKDQRIIVIDKKNGGVSSARNAGLKAANGRYVMFVDSDDWVADTYCSEMVEQLRTSKAEMALCGFADIQAEHRVDHYPLQNKKLYYGTFEDICLDMLKSGMTNSLWNKLFIREKIHACFNEARSMGEDLEFNLKYMEDIHTIICVNSILYYYDKTNGVSLTHQNELFLKSEVENLLIREQFIKNRNITWPDFSDQFYISFFRLMKRYYRSDSSYVYLRRIFREIRLRAGYLEEMKIHRPISLGAKCIDFAVKRNVFFVIYLCLLIKRG